MPGFGWCCVPLWRFGSYWVRFWRGSGCSLGCGFFRYCFSCCFPGSVGSYCSLSSVRLCVVCCSWFLPCFVSGRCLSGWGFAIGELGLLRVGLLVGAFACRRAWCSLFRFPAARGASSLFLGCVVVCSPRSVSGCLVSVCFFGAGFFVLAVVSCCFYWAWARFFEPVRIIGVRFFLWFAERRLRRRAVVCFFFLFCMLITAQPNGSRQTKKNYSILRWYFLLAARLPSPFSVAVFSVSSGRQGSLF